VEGQAVAAATARPMVAIGITTGQAGTSDVIG